MSMKPSEILIAARAVIAKGWTQKACARDAEGNSVSIDSEPEKATCFCAFGGMLMGADEIRVTGYSTAFYKAEGFLDRVVVRRTGASGGYITYNDAEGRTQEEMLSLFDDAAKLAIEAEEGELRSAP